MSIKSKTFNYVFFNTSNAKNILKDDLFFSQVEGWHCTKTSDPYFLCVNDTEETYFRENFNIDSETIEGINTMLDSERDESINYLKELFGIKTFQDSIIMQNINFHDIFEIIETMNGVTYSTDSCIPNFSLKNIRNINLLTTEDGGKIAEINFNESINLPKTDRIIDITQIPQKLDYLMINQKGLYNVFENFVEFKKLPFYDRFLFIKDKHCGKKEILPTMHNNIYTIRSRKDEVSIVINMFDDAHSGICYKDISLGNIDSIRASLAKIDIFNDDGGFNDLIYETIIGKTFLIIN